jgi:hypothetical protein
MELPAKKLKVIMEKIDIIYESYCSPKGLEHYTNSKRRFWIFVEHCS